MGPAQELRAAPPLGTVETGGEDLQKPKEGAQWPGRRIWYRNNALTAISWITLEHVWLN